MRDEGAFLPVAIATLLLFVLFSLLALGLAFGNELKTIPTESTQQFIAYWKEANRLLQLQIAFTAAALFTVGTLAAFLVARKKHYFGDARWAYRSEIRKAGLFSKTGILLGRYHGRFLRSNRRGHLLVAAPTRSGKGVGLVIPNLLSWPDSVVILDIKHENYAITSGFRKKHGQAVYQWSPSDEKLLSHCFNPLDTIRSDEAHRVSDIQRLATILLPPLTTSSDPMWQNEARDLLLGVILYVLDTPDVPSTLGEVYRTLKTDAGLREVFLHLLETRQDELDIACVMSLANFAHKAPKERSGVRSTVTAALSLWSNPVIDAATSKSDFDLTQLRKKRMSIYVGVTLNQLKSLATLLNLFFQQTVDVLSRAEPGSDEPYPVLLLIDEFASLGKMDVVANSMAFLAGFNVRMMNIIQGLGQLDSLYGKGMENILQNSGVQIFFSSNDDVTTRYISKRMGTKTIQTESRSESGGFRAATKNRSYTRRDMMLPEEVRQLDDQSEIIFLENRRPIRAEKIRYYQDTALQQRLECPSPVPKLEMQRIMPRSFDLPVSPHGVESFGDALPNPETTSTAQETTELNELGETIAALLEEKP